MTKKRETEISDKEIRVICPPGLKMEEAVVSDANNHRRKRSIMRWVIVSVFVISGIIGTIVALNDKTQTSNLESHITDIADNFSDPGSMDGLRGEVMVTDTVVRGVELIILQPENASPELNLGMGNLCDTTFILAAPAAGVREDNGKVVGSCVIDGKVVGRGERKGGYCAIIDSKITIGAADATPLFEQAVETGGDFFRQYPLVVAGQEIVNKPKGSSLRKALAEVDGKIVVILSKKPLSFGEFSETLVNAGISNAIYLEGSIVPVYYRGKDGIMVWYGDKDCYLPENTTYIVWK